MCWQGKLVSSAAVGQFEETRIPEKAAALKTAALHLDLGAASAILRQSEKSGRQRKKGLKDSN